MLAVNDRMGARWWLQYEIDDNGDLLMYGHWRQDRATIPDDAPCFNIHSQVAVSVGPQRGQMRLSPDPEKATTYNIAAWKDGPPDEPETSEPPPPEFDGYAWKVISQLDGTGAGSEFVLPMDSCKNLLRQSDDLVDTGRRMGSNPDYVANEIVKRAESKGVTVPRQDPKKYDDEEEDDYEE